MESFCYPFRAMGTPCELQFFTTSFSRAESIAHLVINDVRRLEHRYSRYRSDSLLSTINQVAIAGKQITVDQETASLLNYAETCYQQSDGLFDITAGILRQAWHFGDQTLPDPALIESLLRVVGWQHLDWQPPTLKFRIPGMELDFGGIVKEYAADRAATLCSTKGIHHGFVNLGGDIKIIGPQLDGSPWQIGVRHPNDCKQLLTTLSLSSGALASSGDYERCLTVNGVRYGHILNPKTGWPVSHLAAVSVVGEYCVVAGSASTIAMLKENQGGQWLECLGLDHFWIDIHGNIGGSLL